MSFSEAIRDTVTAPGYLLKINDEYYSSRGVVLFEANTWSPLCFEVSGLNTDGGASLSANVAITDTDRLWTGFIDNVGLDDLSIDVWQLYQRDIEDDVVQKVFSGEASAAQSNGNILTINALGVRDDYAITPRNRWLSSFSNVTAGSAVVINGETVRFEL